MECLFTDLHYKQEMIWWKDSHCWIYCTNTHTHHAQLVWVHPLRCAVEAVVDNIIEVKLVGTEVTCGQGGGSWCVIKEAAPRTCVSARRSSNSNMAKCSLDTATTIYNFSALDIDGQEISLSKYRFVHIFKLSLDWFIPRTLATVILLNYLLSQTY